MKADFSKIINNSIRITKNNKKLWVMGLVLVALGAGGGFNIGGGFNDAIKQFKEPASPNNSVELPWNSPPQQEVFKTPAQVLGSATTSVSELLKTIPPALYVALAIILLVSIAVGIAVSLYGKSWAQSGLIKGIEKESVGESLTLYQMSDHGKLNAVEVIKLKVYPGLLLGLVVSIFSAILVVLSLLIDKDGRVLIILLAIFFALPMIVLSIIVRVGQSLGTLAINLESLKWEAAFKKGLSIFKKYLLDVSIMYLINGFAGCVVGIASLIGMAVLGGIGMAAVFGVITWLPFMVAAGPIVFLALLALIMFMGLCGTILVVFKQSTWVLLYKQLTEVPNGQQ